MPREETLSIFISVNINGLPEMNPFIRRPFFFFLYRLTWLLYQGALLDIRHTNNQEESETQGQQAQRGNKQKVFSLEERRLRENMMVEVK